MQYPMKYNSCSINKPTHNLTAHVTTLDIRLLRACNHEHTNDCALWATCSYIKIYAYG